MNGAHSERNILYSIKSYHVIAEQFFSFENNERKNRKKMKQDMSNQIL